MAQPRIVSLLPSATEIAVALGLGESLVGRSHECDYPLFVKALPVVTSTRLEKGLTSRQIDDRIQEIVRQGLSVYEVDTALLRDLRPDLIMTQSQCAVCAVTPADLEEALGDWIGTAPTLLSLAPDTLEDVWSDFAKVAEAAGIPERASSVVGDLKERMSGLSRSSAERMDRPRVAAIEWIDPLMAAGNWVPELIEAAGGHPLFARAGEHSSWLNWDDLIAADPDLIVAMPCGYLLPQTLADLGSLVDHFGWKDLTAVRKGKVFAVDGHHLFNRPGPRLVESAELIAQLVGATPTQALEMGRDWISIDGV